MTTRYILVQVEIGDDSDKNYIELYRQIGQVAVGSSFVRAAFEMTDDGLMFNHDLVVRTRNNI